MKKQISITHEYFQALEISTLVGCSVRCIFCPQDIYVSNYVHSPMSNVRILEPKTFKTFLDNLKGSPVKKLIFSGYVENFLNAHAPELILMGHKRGFKIEVVTTGVGLTFEIIDRLKKIPFERFAFSLQPLRNRSRLGIKNETMLWDIFKYAISKLNNIHGDVVCKPENRDNSEIKKIEKFVKNKNLHFRTDWHDRAGNLLHSPMTNNRHFKAPVFCARPLTNIVQPNGDVSLCCMDWSLKHIVGNLYINKYIDIINSYIIKKIIYLLEHANLDDLLCVNCHYLEEVTEDWIPVSQRPY